LSFTKNVTVFVGVIETDCLIYDCFLIYLIGRGVGLGTLF